MLLSAIGISSSTANDIEKEVEAIDAKISKEKKKIKEEKAKQDKAKQALRKSKKEINSLKKNLDKVSQKEKELLKELRLLETKERKLKSSLAKEKTRLLEVVKQAYIAGHSPRIGLDQNGEITSYYLAKIAAQRSEKIKKYSVQVEEIKQLQTKKQNVRRELRKVKRKTNKDRNVAEKKRERSSSEINATKSRIKNSETKIRSNEKRLSNLFVLLKKRKEETIKNKNLPNSRYEGKLFTSLKGKLRLPAMGTVTARFGQKRGDSDVYWEGVFIASKQGNSVKLIAGGSVVYSDWLRGFGNLVIIDHGEGYHTLYGNNEVIWVSEGDQLEAGDQLGTVGNSGGHSSSGVYFEVRKNSKPLDPLEWVNITE